MKIIFYNRCVKGLVPDAHFNYVDYMNEYIRLSEYKMGDNVNEIVSLFHTQSTIPEGKIRIKDLKAAADLIGEPIFVSKGKSITSVFNNKSEGELFEKNLLVDFTTVRDRFLKLFKDAIYSLDKNNMFYNDFHSSGFNSRFDGFNKHIEYYYHIFYPHNTEEIKEHIKYVVKELWEEIKFSHTKDCFDENETDDDFEENEPIQRSCFIKEETFWLANIYTKDFVEAMKSVINKYDDKFDEDCGLCHNGITGIKIDMDKNMIEFYAILHIDDIDGDYTERCRYLAGFYEVYKNNSIDYNNNEYIENSLYVI